MPITPSEPVFGQQVQPTTTATTTTTTVVWKSAAAGDDRPGHRLAAAHGARGPPRAGHVRHSTLVRLPHRPL